MKRVFIFILLGTLMLTVNAQKRRGTIQIVGDRKVTDLVNTHIEFNERVKTIPGFRIQIASETGSNSKAKAFSVKERFLQEYPEVSAYLVFDEPNFKVKVGDFISKLDAFVFMQKIKSQYPCTIIKDNVYPIHSSNEEILIETDIEQ
ncbi:MAG: hypothetical protein IKT84_01695 [Bacteroidales bacterium]|jgi:hypothetical protein|nr:hypothetical protein [Bacteroidales bacterium]MBR5832303.1 hypothetical protein [Bacteroidales bacterium]